MSVRTILAAVTIRTSTEKIDTDVFLLVNPGYSNKSGRDNAQYLVYG
jgi:hypothetical protein